MVKPKLAAVPAPPAAREVHPAAAAWPMMPEDELRSLADSIAANGLRYPIVLDSEDRILDGRNRLAACELAGVEPTFVVHEGDPLAFVLDANSHRRHVTQAQRAMVGVLMKAELSLSQREEANLIGVAQPLVLWARTVLREAPDLVDSVVAGASLREAYDAARKRREAYDADAEALAGLPDDLRVLVSSGVRDLAGALDEARLRERLELLDEDMAEYVRQGVRSIEYAEQTMVERKANIAEDIAGVVSALKKLRRMAGYPVSNAMVAGYWSVPGLPAADLELLGALLPVIAELEPRDAE